MKNNLLRLGQTFTDRRCIKSEDIFEFARLSGDINPLHLDEKIAKSGVFKKRVAHGLYVASFISKILGNEEYGLKGIYLSQTLNFLSPVYIDNNVDIVVEIVKIEELRSVITLKTTCKVGLKSVIDGVAEIYIP
jgi:3-hydroxybutyryl-CoA dehydratase